MSVLRKFDIKWSSERNFIFVTIAAAVGLGNMWRFPYMVGENGGAAFILAYILAVFILGLPIMILEIAAGRAQRGGPVRTFKTIWSKSGWFGWIIVLLTFLVMSYYLVITGWTLGFAIDSYTGSIKTFDEFVSGYASIYYFLIITLITGFIVFIGTQAIEWLSKILMPIFFISILFLVFNSLTLPGKEEALKFLFTPDFSALKNPFIWLLAFGQAFYSLAVGQGYLITYGRFLKKEINLPRSTSIIASVETLVAILSGVMIFPIVFTFGINPAQGTELAFVVLPMAFENMYLGNFLAIIFFSLFFLAAVSSCVAGMQVIKTVMREEFNLPHIKAVLCTFLPIIPLGILSAISFTPVSFEVLGRPFLEVVDMLAANQIIVMCGVIGGAILAWKISKQEIIKGFGYRWRKLGWLVVNIARYLPILILILLFIIWFL